MLSAKWRPFCLGLNMLITYMYMLMAEWLKRFKGKRGKNTQCGNSVWHSDIIGVVEIMYSSLAGVMACCLFDAMPLSEPMLIYWEWNYLEPVIVTFLLKFIWGNAVECYRSR